MISFDLKYKMEKPGAKENNSINNQQEIAISV